MKPYGVRMIEGPDVADIKEMGAASHVGQLPGRSGDFHGYATGHQKATTRRYWARLARRANRAACRERD